MGGSTLIDIVSSMLISGLLLLVALQMDEKAVQNTYNSQASLTVQQNLTSVVELLEYDFRKIGYCKTSDLIPAPRYCISYGDTSTIWFVYDVNNSGSLDTIKYWLGGTIPHSPNPDVRYFYRQVDGGTPAEANLGITQFTIKYYDTFGNSISTPFYAPNMVQVVTITIRVEPTAAYDSTYSTNYAVWRQTRLVSRNLKR
ncbi:MAG TPA: hypothetical protein VIS48_12235 [Candidatus Kryptonia bacterium]